jgi:cell division protein FtsB
MKYHQGQASESSFWDRLWQNKRLSGLMVFGLAIYLGVLLIRSIAGNYAVNKELYSLQNNIDNIARENEELEDKINYYKSDTFKEIEARAKLGYQAIGESVVILPKDQKAIDELDSNKTISLTTESQDSTPNYQRWWRLFFR